MASTLDLEKYTEIEASVLLSEKTESSNISRITNISLSTINRIITMLKNNTNFKYIKEKVYMNIEYILNKDPALPRLRIEVNDNNNDLESLYNNKIIKQEIWNKRIIKQRMSNYDNSDIPVRIKKSIEINCIDTALNLWISESNPILANYLHNLKTIQKTKLEKELFSLNSKNLAIRYIKRISYKNDEIRIDLSAIRFSKNMLTSKTPEFINYEIEIEYIGTKKYKENILLDGMKKYVLPIMLDTPNPSFLLKRHTLNIQNKYYEFINQISIGKIPFMPKAKPLKNSINLCGVKYVSIKADGVTAYLFIDNLGNAFVVTKDSKNGILFRKVPSNRINQDRYSEYNNCLLIGELVKYSNEQHFLVFDIIAYTTKGKVTSLLDKYIDFRLDILGKIVNALASSKNPFIKFKPFKKILQDGKSIDLIKFNNEEQPYKKDGFIFMGNQPLYIKGYTRPDVLKWKPKEQQTIDLLIYYDFVSEKQLYLYARRFIINKSETIYTFAPVDFKKLKIKPPNSLKTENNSYIGPDMIVEFAIINNILVPIRIREDKTARHILAMNKMKNIKHKNQKDKIINKLLKEINNYEPNLKYFPIEWVGNKRSKRNSHTKKIEVSWSFPDPTANNDTFIIDTINIINTFNTIELSKLNTFISNQKSYFTDRKEKSESLKLMTIFNNNVKALLLSNVLQNKISVKILDLACGDGNDLPRWNKFNKIIKKYDGFDKDKCALYEANKRINLDKYKYFKSKITFREADMGNIILNKQYDLITIFHAIHYAKENFASLFSTLSKHLNMNGHIILIYMDESNVKPSKKSKWFIEDKDTHWNVNINGIGGLEPKLSLKDIQSEIKLHNLEIVETGNQVDKFKNELQKIYTNLKFKDEDKLLSGFYNYVVIKQTIIKPLMIDEDDGPLSENEFEGPLVTIDDEDVAAAEDLMTEKYIDSDNEGNPYASDDELDLNY